MSKEMLTVKDVNTMLERLSEAIGRDQTYVDALPREMFSPEYDDNLWRGWRRDHRTFIGKLLATTATMSSADLQQLTDLASCFDPAAVRQVALEMFADVASGSIQSHKTARKFFAALTAEVVRQGRGRRGARDAREAISQWFLDIDPLTIARDPECGYPLGLEGVHVRQAASRPTP